MSDRIVLALDIGTSSARTALFDDRCRRLPETTAQQTYRLTHTKDGGAELSPQVVRAALLRCLRHTLAGAPRLSCVSTSCFIQSLLGVDAAGRPLTPVYTWADTRCRQEAAALRRKLSERRYHAQTGCMLRAPYWPAKLLWLRQTQPAVFRRVAQWMSFGEWFTQQAQCSYSMASGTGLFDLDACDWDDALLRRCHVRRAALNPVGMGTGMTNPALATRFPVLANVPWLPVIADAAASNLGSGATRPGIVALNFGTSAAVRILATGRRPRTPFGLFCYRVDEERWLVGGASGNAGNLHQWCQRVLRLPANAAICADATAHGLKVIPYWVSDRAPDWQEELPGSIIGLTPATTALDILQATREATFRQLAQIAERIPGVRHIIVSGGIACSRADLQMLADVLDKPVTACTEPEASLRGAAVLALGFSVSPPKPGKLYRAREAFNRRHRQLQQRIFAH